MSDWRQLNISILQAYRENKLMPTDKRIVNACKNIDKHH